MTDEQQLEQQLFELGDVMTPGAEFATTVMKGVSGATVTSADGGNILLLNRLWRNRVRAFLVIAGVVMVFFFVLQSDHPGNLDGDNWWLESPAVYAEEIVRTILQVEDVIFRSATRLVLEDDTEEAEGNVRTVVVAQDRYRYESVTPDGRLASVTWSVPDNGEYVITKHLAIQNKTRTRRVSPEEGLGTSPLVRVLDVCELIDQAGQRLLPREVDGQECVGFKIDAGKVHRKHESGTYLIWLDTATKRPVKMIFSRERRMKNERNVKRVITVMDRFEWNPDVPDDVYVPQENPQPIRYSVLR